jgi:hypothetical protein
MLAFHEVVVNNIFEQAPKVPVKLIGNDMMELWFKQDDRFNVPKMECRYIVWLFLFLFLLLGFHLIWFLHRWQAGGGFARGLRFAGAFGHELPLCRASRGTCSLPLIMAPTSRVSFSKRVRGLTNGDHAHDDHQDALNEYSYLAQIAGLKFALASTTRGLTVRCAHSSRKLAHS